MLNRRTHAKTRIAYVDLCQSGKFREYREAEARLHEVDNMILMNSAEIEDKAYRLKSLMKLSEEVKRRSIDTTTQISFDANKVLYDTAELSANQK